MSARGWLALALLLPAVIFERMAYYAARTMLVPHLIEAGVTHLAAVRLITLATTASYFVSLLGGALALALGARATAALGAIIAALALTVLAAGGGPESGVFLLAIGTGLFRPCPVAAAAEVIASEDVGPSGEALGRSPRRFAMIAAFALVSYLGINLGSALAPVVAGALRTTRGGHAVFGLGAALEVLAFLLVGTAALVGFVGRKPATATRPGTEPYRTQPARAAGEASSPPVPSAIAGVALLAVPMLFYGATTSLAFSIHGATNIAPAFFVINPVVVMVTSLVLGALWVAAAIGRWSLTPLRIWGIGFAIFGVGLLPLALGIRGQGVVSLYVVGTIITAVGEAAVGPMATTYAAVSVRPRAAALMVAALSFVAWLSMSGGSGMAGTAAQTPILLASAVVCLVVGVLAAVFAPAIHRKLFAPS